LYTLNNAINNINNNVSAARGPNTIFASWCAGYNLHTNATLAPDNPSVSSLTDSFCAGTEARFGRTDVVLTPNYFIIEVIDYIILGIFACEVFIKIFAEGMGPWRYWTGAEWRWNNFDFFIVVLCLPVWGDTFGGSSVALLRLMRLMRVMKLVKKIPQLQMIVMGLIGGMKSIAYILLLLLIVFYLFAIMGIYAFGLNDAYHFGNLTRALFSLFRASTLEDWTDIMYINIFGCAGYEYDSGIYKFKELGRSGVKWEDGCDVTCDRHNPNAVISAVYWVFFIIISALVMLSLFIGAVTMSMTESMEEMKNEAKEATKAKQMMKARKKQAKLKAAKEAKEKELVRDNGEEVMRKITKRKSSFRLLLGGGPASPEGDTREEVKMKVVLMHAWDGIELLDLLSIHDEEVTRMCKCCQWYWPLSKVSDRVAESALFVNFITVVIIMAGVMVGIQTEINENNRNYASCSEVGVCSEHLDHYAEEANKSIARRAVAGGYEGTCMSHDTYILCPDGCYEKTSPILVLETLDTIILVVFCVEIIVKVIGKFDRPWYYFHVPRKGIDRWNTFDFVVVAGSFLPGSGSLLTILRLLRLLRVLKLLKAFPALQVIVVALISGLGSIAYIGVILIMVFYIFGILAMILYKANDPWHFGTVHISMLSLFRAATLEDWTDIMYTNVYGCANYGAFGSCDDASAGHALKAARIDTSTEEGMQLQIFYEQQANITGNCGEAIDLGYTPFCCCAEHSYEGGLVAYFYFTIFTVLGALVLMTLFIGVITTSMEEAQEQNDKEKEDEDKVKKIVLEAGWGPKMVQQYKICFELLDLDGGGTIDQDELKEGLEKIGKSPGVDELDRLMGAADLDDEAGLDFPSFVRLMVNVTKQRLKDSDGAKGPSNADVTPAKTGDESRVKMAVTGSPAEVSCMPIPSSRRWFSEFESCEKTRAVVDVVVAVVVAAVGVIIIVDTVIIQITR
jgi:hypothetical protein